MWINKPGPISSHCQMVGDLEFPFYWVRGDKGAIIDAGVTATAPLVERAFAPSERTPFFVLLTHSHFDHVGTLGLLRRLHPRLIVAGSLEAANLLAKPRIFDFVLEMNRQREVQEGLEEGRPEVPLRQEDLRVDMVLGEGDVIELGNGVSLEVIVAPGHTRCSLCYLLRPDLVLFGGDGLGALVSETEAGASFPSSFRDYVASLRKVQKLPFLSVALPHQGVLTGVDAQRHIERALAAAEALRQDIAGLLDLGKPNVEIVDTLYPRLHRGHSANEPEKSFRINLEAMVRVVQRER